MSSYNWPGRKSIALGKEGSRTPFTQLTTAPTLLFEREATGSQVNNEDNNAKDFQFGTPRRPPSFIWDLSIFQLCAPHLLIYLKAAGYMRGPNASFRLSMMNTAQTMRP
jgi:hypothetical protein